MTAQAQDHPTRRTPDYRRGDAATTARPAHVAKAFGLRRRGARQSGAYSVTPRFSRTARGDPTANGAQQLPLVASPTVEGTSPHGRYDHSRLRRLLAPFFTVAPQRPGSFIESTVAGSIDQMGRPAPVDFVEPSALRVHPWSSANCSRSVRAPADFQQRSKDRFDTGCLRRRFAAAAESR